MKATLRPSGGHILDIDSLELSSQFLSNANNVHTRKGFPSRIGGRRVAYSGFGSAALHLMNFELNTFNWWLAFKASTISARQAGTTTDISKAGQLTVSNSYEWSSDLLNGIPVFTNGKDPLLYWDGNAANDAVAVPGWPASTICKVVVAFRFHLFALDIDNASGTFENLILWSDAAEPGTLPSTWTPAASNEAGSTIVADTPGRCVTGARLGTQLMIYKPQSVYAIEYVGQQPDNIFTVRPVLRSQGALSTHCVVDIGNRHFVVGNDDVILFDGISAQSVAENRIKTFLANSIDETNSPNTFVVRDINKREIWICAPEAGSQFATIAHVWDMRRDTWVTRDLDNVRHAVTGFVADAIVSDTWDSDANTWDSDSNPWTVTNINARSRLVLAEPTQLIVEDVSDLTTIESNLQRTDLAFDDDTLNKLTQRVWIEGSGEGLDNLYFRLGARDSTDSEIEWGAYVLRAAGGTPYEVRGRYISVETTHSGTQLYTVTKIVIEAVYDGPY